MTCPGFKSVAVAALLYSIFCVAAHAESVPIKLGATLALSGTAQHEALLLAVEDINSAGSERSSALVFLLSSA